MNLYLDNGYVNIRGIIELGLPFNFIVGGRGTGKTYGALQVMEEDRYKFVFMRRTQMQADMISTPEYNPYKKLNSDKGWNIGCAKINKMTSGFYEMQNINGKMKPEGEPKAIILALSTIANMRGFDASDYEILLYDEFIPESHERPIKEEGKAFKNACETINRNRELEGHKPVQCICLANSNTMTNALFLELGLVKKAEEMRRREQEYSIMRERGIGLFVLRESDISEKKADTALYKLGGSDEFNRMALSNEFVTDEIGRIKSRNLVEYRAVVTVGEITIYKHKSKPLLYVSTHLSGTCPQFGSGDIDRSRFKKKFFWLWSSYMKNNIEFEEYLCEILFNKYFE